MAIGGGLYASEDASSWDALPAHGLAGGMTQFAASPDLLVAGRANGNFAVSDDDGQTWTGTTVSGISAVAEGAWGDGAGRFVFARTDSTIFRSDDGTSWTSAYSAGSSERHGVSWSDELGLFCVVGAGSGRIVTSPDAETWTQQNAGVGASFYTVTWAAFLHRFIAAGNAVVTSPDGVSWTQRSVPSGLYRGSAASDGVAVLVGDAGLIATSSDGVSWTQQTSPSSSDIVAVTWSPAVGLFAAVCSSGEVLTSSDGTSWQVAAQPSTATGLGILWVQRNDPPHAPGLSHPVGGATIDRTSTVRFGWDFDDPDDGDTQSRYQLEVREQGDTGVVYDADTETPNEYHDLPSGTLDAGGFEWRARTWDAAGADGPWSGWEPFVAATPPDPPTITDPTDGQTIPSETYAVEWSTSNQGAYQLRRVADDAGSPDSEVVYFDTGTVQSSGARSRTVEFDTNQRWEHVQVRIRRDGLWSTWSSKRVEVSYTPPAEPAVAVGVHTVVVDGVTYEAGLTVAASHPTPQGDEPDVVAHDVWRRRAGTDGGDGIRVAADVTPSATWIDWAVASGIEYEYRVRAIGDNDTRRWSPWTA